MPRIKYNRRDWLQPRCDSFDTLENQLEVALHTFEDNASMAKSIVAWEWIVSTLLN